MILIAAVGMLTGGSFVQANQTTKPPVVQLQEKTYSLTQAMELKGESATLDGHGATLTGNGKGVGLHIGPFSHVTVKNIKFSGFATAIVAQGCPDLTIENISIAGSGVGVHLEKVTGGLVQALESHGGDSGAELATCSKVIFEKSDLSKNVHFGIRMSNGSTCIVRDNKAADIADGVGISLADCSHSQVMRNVAVHCGSTGIAVISHSAGSQTDNTVQGNEVSWTTTGTGLSLISEKEDMVIDNFATSCQRGFAFSNCSQTTVQGNIVVACTQFGIFDEAGTKNTFDTNAFVAENGGPIAISFKGADSNPTDVRLLKNVFMGYQKPIHVENASPMTLQSNEFSGTKTIDLADIADVIGKKPIAIDSKACKPESTDFLPSSGSTLQMLSVYDRLGGVRISASQDREMDIIVEGSLSGAFQGEQEEVARYKGQLPIEITFQPRFEMFIRVREVAVNPAFVSFFALLGDNSMAKDMPADDSGDTLFKPGYAVDGDTTTTDNAWSPPKGKAGEWWEVDMKSDRTMTAFSILPNPLFPDDFWKRFHIAISSTGLFKGEETTILTETYWLQKPGPKRYYKFAPVVGRYIRIYGDVDQAGVQMKQFGVYGIK